MGKLTSPGPVPSRTGTRRERHRRELLAEIGAVTRELVVAEGTPAVTMAAVAERLGLTAPALYRYVAGRTGLLDLACAAVARELTAELVAHRDTLGTDPLERVGGVCREFRRWSLAHQSEFALVFAHPATRPAHPGDAGELADADDEVLAAALELAWVFEESLLQLWAARPFEVAPDDALAPDLRDALDGYRDQVLARAAASGLEVEHAPIAAMEILLEYWLRIYGLVSIEVFGHLAHAVENTEPLLESVLRELARTVGAR